MTAGNCNGGSCNNRGNNANYWSSTESASSAWRRNFNYSNDSVNRNTNAQTNAFSVRCLKDYPDIPFPLLRERLSFYVLKIS